MKDSESKAMNWSGNIYHKFEAIIPDVNYINIQGTFEYVENHVNTVGGSFKKFCSGVVQDFFPLSMDPVEHEAESAKPERNRPISVDPVKRESEAVRPEGNSAVGSCDGLDVSVSVASLEKQPDLVDANVDELIEEKSMEGHEILDSAISELGYESTDTSETDVNDIKECEDGPFELTLPGVPEPLKELIDAEDDNTSVVLTTIEPEILGQSQEIECSSSSEGAFCDVLSHDPTGSFGALVSDRNGIAGKGLVSTRRSVLMDLTGSLRGNSSDMLSLSLNAIDPSGCVSDIHKEPYFPISTSAMLTKDGVAEKQLIYSGSTNLSLKSKDDSTLDIATDFGMETINLHDEVKLGESCVFVDDTVLYAVSRRARKLGSYKKKIQDLFTSKKRLAKEYEQLAIWYGDADIDSSPNQKNSQTRQPCDSEWELL